MELSHTYNTITGRYPLVLVLDERGGREGKANNGIGEMRNIPEKIPEIRYPFHFQTAG